MYYRPEKIDDALKTLSKHKLTIAAGCTDLLPSTQQDNLGDNILDITAIESLRNIEVENGILEFVIPRRNVYATNSHIFLVWMVISSFLILSIAILFLRQQIKPIEKLAKAAESFGIGRKIKNFKI